MSIRIPKAVFESASRRAEFTLEVLKSAERLGLSTLEMQTALADMLAQQLTRENDEAHGLPHT